MFCRWAWLHRPSGSFCGNVIFFFSSRRRHTRYIGDWSSDVCSSDLPQFPTMCGGFADRLPSWSSGGPDGRSLLDSLLKGLTAHLAPGGRAIITHNAFVDLDLSRSIRSEERRVGKECRPGWGAERYK